VRETAARETDIGAQDRPPSRGLGIGTRLVDAANGRVIATHLVLYTIEEMTRHGVLRSARFVRDDSQNRAAAALAARTKRLIFDAVQTHLLIAGLEVRATGDGGVHVHGSSIQQVVAPHVVVVAER
jgi:hypothetical protein